MTLLQLNKHPDISQMSRRAGSPQIVKAAQLHRKRGPILSAKDLVQLNLMSQSSVNDSQMSNIFCIKHTEGDNNKMSSAYTKHP